MGVYYFNDVLKYRAIQPYAIELKFKKSQTSVYDLKRTRVTDFYLGQYLRSIKALKKANKLLLPSHISIYFADKSNDWFEINIAFDKASLFEQFNRFKVEHKEGIYFDLILDRDEPSKTEVLLKAGAASTKAKNIVASQNAHNMRALTQENKILVLKVKVAR